jgi:hypothetical protein
VDWILQARDRDQQALMNGNVSSISIKGVDFLE